jgi:hypothetical protein
MGIRAAGGGVGRGFEGTEKQTGILVRVGTSDVIGRSEGDRGS